MEVVEITPSVTHLSKSGERLYDIFHLFAIVKSCLPVTELDRRSKGELCVLANRNFREIVIKADFNVICVTIECDVPCEEEHETIKKVCIAKWLFDDKEDSLKVRYYLCMI